MCVQQTNLSNRLEIPWVSCLNLLMSLELYRFPLPEARVLYLFEKFPKDDPALALLPADGDLLLSRAMLSQNQ